MYSIAVQNNKIVWLVTIRCDFGVNNEFSLHDAQDLSEALLGATNGV